jgi:hypothetical protein
MTVYGTTTILNTYTTETSNLVLAYTGPRYALDVMGRSRFESNVYVPTAAVGDNSTQVATTAFVSSALSGLAASNFVTGQGYITASALSGLAASNFVNWTGVYYISRIVRSRTFQFCNVTGVRPCRF